MYPILVNALLCTLWILCGLSFLRSPGTSAKHLGYEGLSSEALIDIRASFGGVCLATGLGSMALSLAGQVDNALWLQIILLSGYAGGRAIGLLMKPGSSRQHRRWLSIEIALLFFALTAQFSVHGGLS